MSADVNDEQHLAAAGMGLLDAAKLAEGMRSTDRRLIALTESGCSKSMPNRCPVFAETHATRAAIQRPLARNAMSGSDILALIVSSSGAP